ncbi:MAG: N-acetylmuramoyl-L-alanine amidase [Clostridia bacterium]|nr:N-acetylmuramoyl-L-alanine amidase [Clostridia bacterium]
MEAVMLSTHIIYDRKFRLQAVFLSFLLSLALLFSAVPIFLSHPDSIPAWNDAKEKIYVLDAGHGGEDCGTIGQNGVYEKDLNFEITMELGSQLTELGYTVVYTRTEDKLLYTEAENIKGLRKIYDLKNRVKVAQSYSDATFISLHMNSFSDPKYSGLQVFYSENNAVSYQLAASIQGQVKEKLQPKNNRSIRAGDGLYLLENLSCPAVLIECGFLSNPVECEKLCEKEYQKQLCFAILCGIMETESKNN